MSMLDPVPETRADAIASRLDLFDQMMAVIVPALPDMSFLTHDEYAEVLEHCITRRAPYHFRRSAPRRPDSEVAYAWHKYNEWLSSNGNLHGLFLLKWSVSDDVFDRTESTLVAIRELTRRASPAIQAWRRTGIFNPAVTDES